VIYLDVLAVEGEAATLRDAANVLKWLTVRKIVSLRISRVDTKLLAKEKQVYNEVTADVEIYQHK